ncbi:alpha/beta hydrolase [Sporosarcina ureae]|uniref:alpha/beta hydrolase n=1 Tax=Sporosarcina ureae TaxID=1571 RepID=UPI0026EB3F4E|nr:alpha/beta hydrolase [Sporosarcina ureae]
MKKTPLLLLPGTLCNEELWKPQIDALQELAISHVPDLSKIDTIKGLAVDVLEKAPKQFALAGLSLGGIVALEIMRLAPERVLKLALIDTNPFLPTEKQQAGWQEVLTSDLSADFAVKMTEKLISSLFHIEQQDDPELQETLYRMAASVGTDGYINQLKAVKSREEQTTILSAIQCPTIIVVGKQDTVCPPSMSEYLHEQIAHSELHLIDQAAHLPTLEQPVIVNELMKKWLSN